MTRRLIPTALAALLVAGCASDDGAGATTPTPAPEEATTTTETGEALTTDARVTELPNGRHLVFIQQVADDGSTLAIDLAIWFSGEEANAAAAEDGQTEIPVPNDYYIRNADPAIIEVPVSDDVAVTSVWFDYTRIPTSRAIRSPTKNSSPSSLGTPLIWATRFFVTPHLRASSASAACGFPPASNLGPTDESDSGAPEDNGGTPETSRSRVLAPVARPP
ncbi:MAG: hypothetical protein ACRD02_05560 [Acidimicrobiia bacterium]